MTDRKFGAVVAPEGKAVRRSKEMRLDTDVPQFKYAKTVFIKRTMPAGTSSITVEYPHEFKYLPSFSTYIKGFNGRWGKLSINPQSVGLGAWKEFPYAGYEQVDAKNYTAIINSNDANVTIPQHQLIIRVTFLYDEVER